MVEGLVKYFKLPKYTNNELSEKTTAADIVSEVSGLSLDIIINVIKGEIIG